MSYGVHQYESVLFVLDVTSAASDTADTLRRSDVDDGGEEDEPDEGKESGEDLHCSARSLT